MSKKNKTGKQDKGRKTVVHPFHGLGSINGQTAIGFEFGKSGLSKKGAQEFDRRIEGINDFLINTNHKIKLRGYASRPGTEAFNLNLSLERAETVKARLVEKYQVDPNRIEIVGLGEMDVRTKLAEANEQDDHIDNPENRSVTLDIEPMAEQDENAAFGDTAVERFDQLGEDRENGIEPFREVVEPYADLVGKETVSPGNPFGEAPSDNVDKFADQAVDKILEPLKAMKAILVDKDIKPALKMAAKYISGGLLDMVRSNSANEVASQRAFLYDALAKAVAAGIDDTYSSDLTDMSPKQLALYNNLRNSISRT